MKTEMDYGLPYLIKGKLVKKKSYNSSEWVSKEITAIEVIIIGKRTLKNGTYCNEDGLNYFTPKEHFIAYLVSEKDNMQKNPFYILEEHIHHYAKER